METLNGSRKRIPPKKNPGRLIQIQAHCSGNSRKSRLPSLFIDGHCGDAARRQSEEPVPDGGGQKPIVGVGSIPIAAPVRKGVKEKV